MLVVCRKSLYGNYLVLAVFLKELFHLLSASSTNHNPMKDFEVQSPPEDSVSCIEFSPTTNLLVAGSWANDVSTVIIKHYFWN